MNSTTALNPGLVDDREEHRKIHKLVKSFIDMGPRPGSQFSLIFATRSFRRTLIFLVVVTTCFFIVIAKILIRELIKAVRKSRQQKRVMAGGKNKMVRRPSKPPNVSERRVTKTSVNTV